MSDSAPPGAAALARTLVLARTQTRPGHQMGWRGKRDLSMPISATIT